MLPKNWKDRDKHPAFIRANQWAQAPPQKHAPGARMSAMVHVLASLVASARRSLEARDCNFSECYIDLLPYTHTLSMVTKPPLSWKVAEVVPWVIFDGSPSPVAANTHCPLLRLLPLRVVAGYLWTGTIIGTIKLLSTASFPSHPQRC